MMEIQSTSASVVAAKVLIVEDEAPTLKMLLEELFVLGIEPVATHDGQRAARWFNERRFDAILIEAGMPPVGSLHLAQQVRGSLLNRRTPVLLLAGEEDQPVVEQVSSAGRITILKKPLDRAVVARALQTTPGVLIEERRRFHRAPISVPVTCQVESRTFMGQSVDISEYGMQFQIDLPLPVRQSVQLSFMLPGQSVPMNVWGVVVREAGDDRFGVLFTQISPEAGRTLRAFLV